MQKYGGSSLATLEQIEGVAKRVRESGEAGNPVVVVVSARGDTTDELLRLAREVGAETSGREVDQLLGVGETASAALLALALHRLGVPAYSLSGVQTGILATGTHGRGVIVAVDTEPITKVLALGAVAVVAGFQGMNERLDLITLGRGGSDTTAVAIAAELGADRCEIYTDVDGVYTADPRIVPPASLIPLIDVDVMAEMSSAGAQVLHSRAVDLAAAHGVDIHVLHSTRPGPGSVIAARSDTRREMLESSGSVTGVAVDAQVARVGLLLPDADATAQLFDFFARESIFVDMATLHDAEGGIRVGMTVDGADVDAVRSYVTSTFHGEAPEVDRAVAKISVVGRGLLTSPECAARALRRLRRAGIAVNAVATSQLRISMTVPADAAVRAARLLHREFGLESLDTEVGSTSPVPA
ncbi:aspartate kinase [Microbispora siamensis]|uniref:aspartate kinase n=1 Tax=Microbispora siamensis TaxID=564413 RepID=UPI001EF2EB92|nr:aspartate kinase [Microbispora siamensis]